MDKNNYGPKMVWSTTENPQDLNSFFNKITVKNLMNEVETILAKFLAESIDLEIIKSLKKMKLEQRQDKVIKIYELLSKK